MLKLRMTTPCLFILLLVESIAVAQSPVPKNAKLEKIASGFQFVEGPLWKDSTLLFSDISANTIYQWTPGTAKTTVYLKPSNSSNGLTLDKQGRLVFCQMGYRRVARIEANGTQTALASMYNGKKLNSPNDVVVKSDGAIFFTDPPLNIPAGQKQELSFSGIFRISPFGDLQLLDSSLAQPNGICFSPDESKLYVNNSAEKAIYVWDVVNDSTISDRRVFANMRPTGYADGMKVDSAGNLFSAGPLGIWVFAPDGTVLDTILIPTQTSNCNWGDADGKTLYITSSNSVYRIRLATVTGVEGDNLIQPRSFRLYSNFPNPFNPSTNISFDLDKRSHVELRVFDLLGELIRTLVNDELSPGNHVYKFDGINLSSGVYMCRLDTEVSAGVRKMVLIK